MVTIKIQNGFFGYSNKKEKNIVLQNVNLTLEKGKLIALIGENGAGKSTFLKSISGIIPPLDGTIEINNIALNKISAQELAQKMSLVLTDALPPSQLTVYELVALGRQPYTNWLGKLTAEDKEIINNALTATGAIDYKNKKHTEISDGQLQKALISRALAQDTSIIILDEPSTHLDLVNKVQLIKLLKKLALTTQKTILFSTHDVDLAIQMSDEMLVVLDQKIIQNTPCKLIENGVFEQLFKNENILFDAVLGKFKVV